MASSHNNAKQIRIPEPVRRGRKNAKTDHKKKGKEPQRGLGVEKLERIRMQEILKNPVLNMNNAGLLASEPNMYNGFQSSKFGGYPNGLFGVGSSSGALTDISNENNMGVRSQSEFCTPTSCKKMRYDELYKAFGTFNQNTESGFLGLTIGKNGVFAHPYGYAQPGVELKAVHNQLATNGEGGKLVMEYDFFPSWKNEARKDQQNSSLVAAEAASTFGDDEEITTSLGIGVPGHRTGGFDASVDLSLSLKSSY